MSAAIVDASVLVPALIDAGERGSMALAALPARVHAPSLVRYEVTQVIRRQAIADRISAAVATTAMRDLLHLAVEEWPFEPLGPRIWELRSTVSAYDAAYVALAEHLRAPLITFDRRLASAPGTRCDFVIPD